MTRPDFPFLQVRTRVFLVGCPRSGTTLLQSMLTAHPEIHSFPETQFFNRLLGRHDERVIDQGGGADTASWLNDIRQRSRVALGLAPRMNTKRHAWAIVEQIAGEISVPVPYASPWLADHAREYVRTLDRLTLAAGKTRWVEKTPTHLHYLDTIKRYVPDAVFIHIVRGGADTVASLYDAALKYPAEHWRHYARVDNAVRRWNASVAESRKHIGKPGHLVVRYEDLVERPEDTLQTACRFMDCEFDDSMINDFGKAAEAVVQSNESWKTGNMGGLRSTAGTKFYELFDEAQQQYVLEHLVEMPA